MLDEIKKLIEGLGLPVTGLVAFGWFIKYIIDANQKERQETEKQHREDRLKMLNMLEKIMTHLISKK